MANSYVKCYLHCICVVQDRASLIQPSWEAELYSYMGGILKNHQHTPLAINGVRDHVHVMVSMHATQSIADMMKHVKGASSRWINQRGFCEGTFKWQGGYAALSYSQSQIPAVQRYIARQKEHHQQRGFEHEFQALMDRFEVECDPAFSFHNPHDK